MIKIVEEVVFSLRDAALQELGNLIPESKDEISKVIKPIKSWRSSNGLFDFTHSSGVRIAIHHTYDPHAISDRMLTIGKDDFEVVFNIKYDAKSLTASIGIVHERKYQQIYSIDNVSEDSAIKHVKKEIKKMLKPVEDTL